MVAYQPFQENIEVNGKTILSIIEGMGSYKHKGIEFLEKCGIKYEKLTEENWFPQELWLKTFHWIEKKMGKETLFSIGTMIPQVAIGKETVTSAKDALQKIDLIYHKNHRYKNGKVLYDPKAEQPLLEGIGHYYYEDNKEEKNSAKIIANTPYPCDFEMGLIVGFVKPFVNRIFITHEEPENCRMTNPNSNQCIYKVQWDE